MKNTILILFVLGAFVGKAYGQDTLLVTFREAVKIGLENNVAYQSSVNDQDVLKMEKISAQLGHLPRININNNLYRQTGQQFQQVEGELIVTDVQNDILSSGLNVNLPIFNGGRRLSTTFAARLFDEAGKKNLERAAQEVIFNVAQQYLQVLMDRELYEIALQNLENQKQQLMQIEGFVEAGIRTLSDQYNQQSEVARLETVALDAKIQWETDLWALAETLQLDPNTVPQLVPVQIETISSDYLAMDLDELYELSLENRKDFSARQLLEEGNKKMINAARSAMYPQINAFFNYNTFYTSLDQRSFNEQLLRIYPQQTIGFSINIPIFNNFDNRLAVTRNKVAFRNQALELGAMERRLYQETKLAYENYKAAIKRQEATRIQLSAAEEAQEVIRERFRLGVSNFVDLAQANQQLVTAQSDFAQSQYTLYFQEVILQYALGVLDVEV